MDKTKTKMLKRDLATATRDLNKREALCAALFFTLGTLSAGEAGASIHDGDQWAGAFHLVLMAILFVGAHDSVENVFWDLKVKARIRQAEAEAEPYPID